LTLLNHGFQVRAAYRNFTKGFSKIIFWYGCSDINKKKENFVMKKHIYRVVTRGGEGEYRIRDFISEEEILRRHIKIGVDDCSADMTLRGQPVFKGLIGPMSDGSGIIRYESPEVFEQMTKEWSELKIKKRKRTTKNQNTLVKN
jgi:hypothetical protein